MYINTYIFLPPPPSPCVCPARGAGLPTDCLLQVPADADGSGRGAGAAHCAHLTSSPSPLLRPPSGTPLGLAGQVLTGDERVCEGVSVRV